MSQRHGEMAYIVRHRYRPNEVLLDGVPRFWLQSARTPARRFATAREALDFLREHKIDHLGTIDLCMAESAAVL